MRSLLWRSCGLLSTLVDPTFGTTILRLTDANDGQQSITQYSYWPVFNSTRTRGQVVIRPNGSEANRSFFFEFDPSTRQIRNKRKCDRLFLNRSDNTTKISLTSGLPASIRLPK
jgi:Tfp pilus assembly protein PilE